MEVDDRWSFDGQQDVIIGEIDVQADWFSIDMFIVKAEWKSHR